MSKLAKVIAKDFAKTAKKNNLSKKAWNTEEEDAYRNSDEYLNSFEYLYSQLVNGNISDYKERLSNMTSKEIVQYINWADEMGIGKEKLKLKYIESSKKNNVSKKAEASYEFLDNNFRILQKGFEYLKLKDKGLSEGQKATLKEMEDAFKKIEKGCKMIDKKLDEALKKLNIK